MIVTPDTQPQNDDELMACLASWEWRIFSGALYKITTKGDDAPEDQPDIAVPFIPNGPQRKLLANLHTRNVVLKARQMGFSTLILILALDHALFIRDQECVIIAQTDDAAKKLFRKKIRFAYDNLPEFVRDFCPTVKRTEKTYAFANGSSIEVTASARGGTPHFLHISEFGKIAATAPAKAEEITSGSLQGVPKSGTVFIESTAEGQSGAFYEMAKRAEANHIARRELGPLEYRFHFFPWFEDAGYRLDQASARRTRISAKEHEYFDTIEGEMDVELTLEQRAWYIQKRDTDFAAHPDLFWREYPSTPTECWQASTEGKYYAKNIAILRREGRIGKLPVLRHVPVDTFWDLGASDDTAIWVRQVVGPWRHWLHFHEKGGAGYLHFVDWIESLGLLLGTHFLPHDAEQKRQQRQDKPSDIALASPIMLLRQMRPSWTFRTVPVVQSLQHGIDVTRLAFGFYRFDEEGCKEGILHLENYSREWNTRLQCWHDHPRHDEHSHAADALRQEAQAFEQPQNTTDKPKGDTGQRRKRATAMTA